MKNLFDTTQAEDLKQRIKRLNPDTAPLWGSMTLAQALAHCTSSLQMAAGILNPKRAPFPASILGPLIKPLVFKDDKPMRRNSPSSPELFQAHPAQQDLEPERAHLLAAIDSFVTGGAPRCSRHPHPFFGPLKPDQWAILMYKHLDHHLRQFGA